MLARPASVAIHSLDLSAWTFDLKLDGIRAMAEWDGWTAKIWSRSGVDLSDKFPDLTLSAHLLGKDPLLLDGEIMTVDGSFDTVAQRGRVNERSVATMVREAPAQFFAFDVLTLGKFNVRTLPWNNRRAYLESIMGNVEDGLHWRATKTSKDPNFPQVTADLKLEGVIAKEDAAQYRSGRSSSWLKFKNRHRVIVAATDYTRGNGAREHSFGALEIHIYDSTYLEGRHPEPVSVGRVGSGFTEQQIRTALAYLDRFGIVYLEVECLGLTKNRQLRQPTFKRFIEPNGTDRWNLATVAQLHDLPTT